MIFVHLIYLISEKMPPTKLTKMWTDSQYKNLRNSIHTMSDEIILEELKKFKNTNNNCDIPIIDEWTRKAAKKLLLKLYIEKKEEEEKMDVD